MSPLGARSPGGPPPALSMPLVPAPPQAKPDPAKPKPPFLKGSLPEYGTLEYMEKLSLVGLTIAAFAYLVIRTAQGGPMSGLQAAAAARGVRG